MESLKLAVWGAGEYYRCLMAGGFLDHITIDLIVDRDPAKGASPEVLREGDYDFILICSTWFNDEIYQELLGLGIAEERIISIKEIIAFLAYFKRFGGAACREAFHVSASERANTPREYYVMQIQHFLKYNYFAEWEASIALCGKAQVVCNWFHDGNTVSSIILIKNTLGRQITISAFSFVRQDVIVTDLRTGGKSLQICMSDDGYGSGVIAAESDEMLLKITCKGCDIPHITLDIGESAWYQRLASEVANDGIRENFEKFMRRQTTQFPYHEEDYLFLKNFADVKDLVMVDCGANYGQSIYSFLLATKYMRVLSFEADPQLTQGLRIIEDHTDRLKLFNVGVGAQKSVMKFYSCEDGNCAGSFLLDDLEKRIYKGETVVEFPVPVERLDDILPEEITINFVKLDIEGLEYDAVRGMMGRIKRDRPVFLIEENPESADKVKELLKDSYVFLYYDYVRNCLVPTNIRASLNYWAIPKEGIVNQEVNRILKSLM